MQSGPTPIIVNGPTDPNPSHAFAGGAVFTEGELYSHLSSYFYIQRATH